MARADLSKQQRGAAVECPAEGRNGTGGVPPRPPLGPVSMLGWQQVTPAYDPAAGETPTTRRATVGADRPRAGVPPAPASADATAGAGDAFQTIPPLPRATPAAQTSSSSPTAAKKPIVISGAKKPRATLSPDDRRGAADITGWPRSKAGRIVALVSLAATLFAALAVAAPLGAPGLSVAFEAYGNAMPWKATAAPAAPTAASAPANPPVASSSNPGKQAIMADIQTVFGPYSAGALNIARCESGYDPNARNTTPVGSSHAEGVFQILYPSTWNDTSYRSYSPYNSWANIRAAYEIFKRDGYSWREWQCRP